MLALYLVRPRNTTTMSRSIPIASPPYIQSLGKQFTYLPVNFITPGCYDATLSNYVGKSYERVNLRERDLAAASEVLGGSFTPTTWALTNANVEKGLPTTSATTLPISRQINH